MKKSSLDLMIVRLYRRRVISLLSGFLLGLSLIVAIGAQNAFVLRQGLLREHVGLVVSICAISDAVLISAGVFGLGRLLEIVPWFTEAARWGGAGFLLVYGARAAQRAVRPATAGLAADRPTSSDGTGGLAVVTRSAGPVAATAVALTWLNPHVYLDTVVLLGSVAATHGQDRWAFAVGAVVASLVWFCALGAGARHLGRWLRGPAAWRTLDAVIAVIMVVLAIVLVAH